MPYGALKLERFNVSVQPVGRGGNANALRGTETLTRRFEWRLSVSGGNANALRGTETIFPAADFDQPARGGNANALRGTET